MTATETEMSQRAPRRLLAAAALACAVLLAQPATAGPFTFEGLQPVPSAPTWQDEVELRLTGTGPCPVQVAGAGFLEGDPEDRLTVRLETTCATHPALPQDFKAVARIGSLAPGTYTVAVEADGELLATPELHVYDLAPVHIGLEEPYTDTEEVGFELGTFSRCYQPRVTARPDLGLIDVLLVDDCPGGAGEAEARLATVSAGILPAGDYELRVFIGDSPSAADSVRTRRLRVHYDDRCVPGDFIRDIFLCLQEGRFLVDVTQENENGLTRSFGKAIHLEGLDDTGAFWFFDEDNIELTVKVLDGCGVNGHYWVFIASGSTVEYEVAVVDNLAPRRTTLLRTYRNEPNQTPVLIHDTTAFPNCP